MKIRVSIAMSFLVGLMIFLVTHLFLAGAALPAVHVGWRSLRTGAWMMHSDPQRRRGLVCGAFCIATGFWKAAAAAFGSVIVFVIASHVTGQPPNMDRFANTMLVLTGGVVITTIVGLAATLAALAFNIRVWVHPGLREMTGGNLSAIKQLPLGIGFNHAIFVVATSWAFPILVFCCFLLVDFRSNAFTSAVILTGTLLGILGYLFLSSRMIAAEAASCWT